MNEKDMAEAKLMLEDFDTIISVFNELEGKMKSESMKDGIGEMTNPIIQHLKLLKASVMVEAGLV